MKVKQVFTYLDHPSIGWSFFIGEMNAIKKFVVSITTQMGQWIAKGRERAVSSRIQKIWGMFTKRVKYPHIFR